MIIRDIFTPDTAIPEKIGNISPEKCTCRESECNEGAIFFHLPHTDGRVRECVGFSKKPICIVTENEGVSFPHDIPIIKVRSARRAYSHACYRLSGFDQRALTLIGISGTCGKTTTAALIYEMARGCGTMAGFIGTGKILINGECITDSIYSMTTPDPEVLYPTLKRMQDAGVRLVAMEASSHALSLCKLDPISFDIGIFTGLSQEHLDYHKTMEEYFNSKVRLFEKSQLSVIACCDEWGKRLLGLFSKRALSVGLDSTANAYACDAYDIGLSGCEFTYRMPGAHGRVKSTLIGDFNRINIMLALCTMKALGNDLPRCVGVLEGIKIDGRQTVTQHLGITVVRDFAHTPQALEKLLNTVYSAINIGQNITVVFGCGGERDRAKRPIMTQIARKYANKLILTSDNPRGERRGEILFDMLKDSEICDLCIILDRRAAIEYAIETAEPGEVVVIAGKGHEKYIIEAGEYRYFSEEEIISYVLEKRKG